MALKEPKNEITEVKHQLLSGTVEQLDAQVKDILNAGWTKLDARLFLFDRANRIMEVFYIFVR